MTDLLCPFHLGQPVHACADIGGQRVRKAGVVIGVGVDGVLVRAILEPVCQRFDAEGKWRQGNNTAWLEAD